MPELGLFALPIVLVPTERIPLHIFEPRYKELIEECLETGDEFGLVLAAGGGAVHDIGTRASVVDVLERLDDGRLNVVVSGGERFRLVELTQGRSFATGRVEPVVDENEPAEPADAERALRVFAELADATGSEVELPDEESSQLDFELAARVELGAEAKQELLSSTSPRTRMARLADLLAAALEAVRAQQALAAHARRNGKVVPPGGRADSL
jgi:ATP-dependent Lon protease